MKVLLFLAAIYTLIIHQCYQKKTTVLPLPAPTHHAQPIAMDTSRVFTAAMPAGYKEKAIKKETSIPSRFILAPSW